MPVEVMEGRAPVPFEEKRLRPDSGGAGAFRGGLGQQVRVRSLSDDPVDFIVGTVDRIDHAPFGLAGGHPGSCGSLTIDGQPVDRRRAQPMLPGQTVTAKLPGGGGFGPVSERDPRLVELDITCGYVTDGMARVVYGYSGRARAATDVGTANPAAKRPVRYSKEEVAVGCDPAARYHRPVPTSGE